MQIQCLRGPQGPTISSSRARPTTACPRAEAIPSGRRGSRKTVGDRQVLSYHLSSPRFGQTDTDIQPAAAAVQPVVTPDEQQLDRGMLARDLGFELQQSQERLQMANALRLEQAAALTTTAPVFDKPAAPVSDKPTAPVSDKPTAPVSDKPTALVSNKLTAPVSDKLKVPVSDKPIADLAETETEAETTAYTGTDTSEASQTEDISLHAVVVDTPEAVLFSFDVQQRPKTARIARDKRPSTTVVPDSSVIGWGNIADLLSASNGTTSNTTAAPKAAGTAVDSSAQTALAPTSSSKDTEAPEAAAGLATAVQASKPQRVIPSKQLEPVAVGWAQSPGDSSPRVFYMPDPLLVPCRLEETTSSEMLMSYDGELVECMWQEAEKIAELKRIEEELAIIATGGLDDSMSSTSSTRSSDEPSPRARKQEVAAAVSAKAATAAVETPQPSTSTVEFKVYCQTQPGERLWLTGDHPSLGGWDLQKALKLKWSEGHIWRASLELPLGTKIAYKAVLQLPNQQYKWQSGSDYLLDVNGTNQPAQQQFK